MIPKAIQTEVDPNYIFSGIWWSKGTPSDGGGVKSYSNFLFYFSVRYGILSPKVVGNLSDYDKSSYWFEGAEYDLQTARAMLDTKRYLYVGFMCHQVAEKSLNCIIALWRLSRFRSPTGSVSTFPSPSAQAAVLG